MHFFYLEHKLRQSLLRTAQITAPEIQNDSTALTSIFTNEKNPQYRG
jgi:hypothetical protein